jgi:hypothetical protein
MKKNVITQTSTAFLRSQHSPKASESLLQQVSRLTHGLQFLATELRREWIHGMSFYSASNGNGLPANDLANLKAAVDEARRVLWFCLGTSSEFPSRETSVDCESQSRGKVLQEQLSASTMEPRVTSTEAGSFFERLHLAIDGYMQDRGIAAADKPWRP